MTCLTVCETFTQICTPVEMVCNVVIRISMFSNVCLNGIYLAVARSWRYAKRVYNTVTSICRHV